MELALGALLLLLLCGTCNCSSAEDFLLPGNVVPSAYHLTLHTYIDTFDANNPDTFVFDGSVTITLHAVETTSSIVLHSHEDITILKSTLRNGSDVIVPLSGPPHYNEINNQLSYELQSGSLDQHQDYKLTIEYSGIHQDDLRGFYRSSYHDRRGNIYWLVATQMHPSDARRVFPCFDEPKYKAKYQLTATVATSMTDVDYNVWTNTKRLNKTSDPISGLTTFTFSETPVELSTYLIAIIVSDVYGSDTYHFNSAPPGQPEDLKEFRTWGVVEHVKYNQEFLAEWTGVAAMEVMVNLTGVGYPYEKVDMFGLPDIKVGAMENWGCITFKEQRVFFPYDDDGAEDVKQSVVQTITHELSHQWFGDLVTLHSWNDPWLNEGFANFFEYHATALINTRDLDTSTWDMIGQHLVDETRRLAFETDGHFPSHAMTQEVYTPAEFEANFDDIAYAKAGSVIKMLMHVVGEEAFYNGLHQYLTNASDAAADKLGTPEKLLTHLEAAYNATGKLPQGLTLQQLFTQWHTQPGYPVLTVIRSPSDPKVFAVKQERFLWGPGEDASSWNVPVSYSLDTEPNFEVTSPSHILVNEYQLTITTNEESKWIVLNNQATGYYRVNYDQANWEALALTLNNVNKFTSVHEYNRVQLVDDALSLARSINYDYLDYTTAGKILGYLKNEQGYLAWKTALNNLTFLKRRLAADQTLYNKFKVFVQDLLGDQFKELGLDVGADDSHLRRLKRILLAEWACTMELPECLASAQASYDAINRAEAPRLDIKKTVYCWAVSSGAAKFDDVLAKSSASMYNIDQLRYLAALGCTRDAANITNYLNQAFVEKSSPLRTQDQVAVIRFFLEGNLENVGVILKYMNDNLEVLSAKYSSTRLVPSLLGLVANYIAKEEDIAAIQMIKSAIDASNDPTIAVSQSAAQSAVDKVTTNRLWLDAKQRQIEAWLDSSSSDSSPGVKVYTRNSGFRTRPSLLCSYFMLITAFYKL